MSRSVAGLVIGRGEAAEEARRLLRSALGDAAPIAVWPAGAAEARSALRGRVGVLLVAGDHPRPDALDARIAAVAERGVPIAAGWNWIGVEGSRHRLFPRNPSAAAILVGGALEASAVAAPGDLVAAALAEVPPGPAEDRLLLALLAEAAAIEVCEDLVAADVAVDPARHAGAAHEIARLEAIAVHPLATRRGLEATLWRRALSLRWLEGIAAPPGPTPPAAELLWILERIREHARLFEAAPPPEPMPGVLPRIPADTGLDYEEHVAAAHRGAERILEEAERRLALIRELHEAAEGLRRAAEERLAVIHVLDAEVERLRRRVRELGGEP